MTLTMDRLYKLNFLKQGYSNYLDILPLELLDTILKIRLIDELNEIKILKLKCLSNLKSKHKKLYFKNYTYQYYFKPNLLKEYSISYYRLKRDYFRKCVNGGKLIMNELCYRSYRNTDLLSEKIEKCICGDYCNKPYKYHFNGHNYWWINKYYNKKHNLRLIKLIKNENKCKKYGDKIIYCNSCNKYFNKNSLSNHLKSTRHLNNEELYLQKQKKESNAVTCKMCKQKIISKINIKNCNKCNSNFCISKCRFDYLHDCRCGI